MIEKKTETVTVNINLNQHDKKIRSNRLFGLWIYLMSDCVMFAVLFSVYSIIASHSSINLINNNVFILSNILLETFLLLSSSLSCGIAVFYANKKNIKMTFLYLMITFFLGFFFLYMEANEFYDLIKNNSGPSYHAFFSAFFTLVGTHGIHVLFGLIFILSIFYQIIRLGLTNTIYTRILCFSLFWHFLDIIWICVFTFVYLDGVL